MSNVASQHPPGAPAPTDFISLAKRWYPNISVKLLTFVWEGYDLLVRDLPAGIDERDLERSITQSLELRIRTVMSGYEPFVIQHSPYERETMRSPPAQPPQYDLAFVFLADERMMWPLEAKVLKTDTAVGEYVKDLRNEFLTGRYAPFSSEGGMLGYLLSGFAEKAFRNIELRVPCTLSPHASFPKRHAKTSDHSRRVEPGKPYPITFRCNHLILEFYGFARSKSRQRSSQCSDTRLPN